KAWSASCPFPILCHAQLQPARWSRPVTLASFIKRSRLVTSVGRLPERYACCPTGESYTSGRFKRFVAASAAGGTPHAPWKSSELRLLQVVIKQHGSITGLHV